MSNTPSATLGTLIDDFIARRHASVWLSDPNWPDVEARIVGVLRRGGWREFVHKGKLPLLFLMYGGRIEIRGASPRHISDLPDSPQILLEPEPIGEAF